MRVEIDGRTYIADTVYTRPNRATRRAMGIRTPLHLLDEYREMLKQHLPDPDGE